MTTIDIDALDAQIAAAEQACQDAVAAADAARDAADEARHRYNRLVTLRNAVRTAAACGDLL